MREYHFSNSSGRSDRVLSSRLSSHSSFHSLQLHRKRTLDEFPMEHSRESTQRMLQERRNNILNQHQKFASTTGESKKLISYSRKRFETALTIKDDESLPPPTPDDNKIFWEDRHPPWTRPFNRHVSLCASPVSQPVHLSTRPCSGPPMGNNEVLSTQPPNISSTSKNKQRIFNHLRGNNHEYPVIRRRLQESNKTFRLVCPSLGAPGCDRCNRPTMNCINKDDFLFIPRSEFNLAVRNSEKLLEDVEKPQRVVEDKESEAVEGWGINDRTTTGEDGEEDIELGNDHASDVFLPSSKPASLIPDESSPLRVNTKSQKAESTTIGKNRQVSLKSGNKSQAFAPQSKPSRRATLTEEELEVLSRTDEDNQREEDEEEESPITAWHCWVDDATVSSVHSNHSDAGATPDDGLISQEPVISSHLSVAHPSHPQLAKSIEQGKVTLSIENINDGKSPTSPTNMADKQKKTNEPRRSLKLKKKGGKQSPELVEEEIIELPPPTPPPEETVEVIDEEPELVLPDYICPSSVVKSTEREIKIWLQKSTFSAANKMLPIF